MELYSAELKGKVVRDGDGVAHEGVLWCNTISGVLLRGCPVGQPFVVRATPPLQVEDHPDACKEPADEKDDSKADEFDDAARNLVDACVRVTDLLRPHPSFEDTEAAVIDWADARGILEHSNARAQLLKTVAELGELADAEAKNDLAGIVDGIGDVLVTLIIYSNLRDLDLSNCLALAYDEIKDRKGWMVEGGVFVKEDE